MCGYVRSDFVNESFDEDNWQIKAEEKSRWFCSGCSGVNTLYYKYNQVRKVCLVLFSAMQFPYTISETLNTHAHESRGKRPWGMEMDETFPITHLFLDFSCLKFYLSSFKKLKATCSHFTNSHFTKVSWICDKSIPSFPDQGPKNKECLKLKNFSHLKPEILISYPTLKSVQIFPLQR